MSFDTQKFLLIEHRITNIGRSTLTAYLLWFFFYALGAHRFYLGYRKSAFAMLMIFVTGIVLTSAFTILPSPPGDTSEDLISFLPILFMIGISFIWLALAYVLMFMTSRGIPADLLADPLYTISSCLPYVGPVLLSIVIVWAIVDAFLIPGIIIRQKDALRQAMSTWKPEQFGQT